MGNAREEGLAAIAKRWAEEEAIWRRENVGKVRFYLINASDESPTFSTAGQAHLGPVMAAIKEAGVEIDAPFMTCDAADAVGGFTGEIAVVANAVGPVLTGILVAWLQAKAGRKVKYKDCDIEVEAQTTEDVRKLLEMAAEQKERRNRKEGQ